MSVDDDLPWDEDPEAPSWYAVEDETRWDPDDDGRLADLGSIESDLEGTAAVVIVRFGSTESDGLETPTHDLPEGAEAVDVHHPDNGPPRRFGPDATPRRPAGLFGLAAGALSDATKFLAGAVSGGRLPDHPELTRVADTVVGVGNGMTTVSTTVAGTAGRLARPAVDLALHPPLVPQRWHPATLLGQFESAGRASRRLGERDAVSLLDQLLPAIVDAVLDRLDLTQIVLDRVDLARVIDAVDLTPSSPGWTSQDHRPRRHRCGAGPGRPRRRDRHRRSRQDHRPGRHRRDHRWVGPRRYRRRHRPEQDHQHGRRERRGQHRRHRCHHRPGGRGGNRRGCHRRGQPATDHPRVLQFDRDRDDDRGQDGIGLGRSGCQPDPGEAEVAAPCGPGDPDPTMLHVPRGPEPPPPPSAGDRALPTHGPR